MTTIVILAAGKGTRMNDQNIPKVLRKVGDKTMIEHVFNTAKALSDDIVIIVSLENIEMIKNVLYETSNISNNEVKYIIQEKQEGTASAVLAAKEEYANKNLLVLLGDVPLIKSNTLKKIIDKGENGILGFIDEAETRLGRIKILEEDSNMYGSKKGSKNERKYVERIIEYSECNEVERDIKIVNSGILFLEKNSIKYLEDIDNNNSKKEYFLTDIVKILREKNIKVRYYEGMREECLGANSPEELKKLNEIYQENKRNKRE